MALRAVARRARSGVSIGRFDFSACFTSSSVVVLDLLKQNRN
jgi:hypothetical protein